MGIINVAESISAIIVGDKCCKRNSFADSRNSDDNFIVKRTRSSIKSHNIVQTAKLLILSKSLSNSFPSIGPNRTDGRRRIPEGIVEREGGGMVMYFFVLRDRRIEIRI